MYWIFIYNEKNSNEFYKLDKKFYVPYNYEKLI